MQNGFNVYIFNLRSCFPLLEMPKGGGKTIIMWQTYNSSATKRSQYRQIKTGTEIKIRVAIAKHTECEPNKESKRVAENVIHTKNINIR